MGNVAIECQMPCQLALAPAMWCPLFSGLHSRHGEWTISETRPRGTLASFRTMEEIAKLLTEYGRANRWILQFRHHQQRFSLDDMSGSAHGKVRVLFFTPAGWCDSVTLSVDENNSAIEIDSFSTGICPLGIPCAPLCSALFCWVPFTSQAGDGDGHAMDLHEMREQQLLAILLDGGMALSAGGKAEAEDGHAVEVTHV